MIYQEALFKRWQGKTIEDLCGVMSDSAKQFAKNIMLFLKRTLKSNDIELVKTSIGHYDFSGFLKNNKTNKYVYFSRDIERYNQPINLLDKSCFGGFLVREAKNETDYRGGNNNFCNFFQIENKIIELSQ